MEYTDHTEGAYPDVAASVDRPEPVIDPADGQALDPTAFSVWFVTEYRPLAPHSAGG